MSSLDFSWRRRTPLIRQSEASECALACIAMIAGFHGMKTDLVALRRRFSLSLKGATLGHLMQVAGQIGFSTRPLRGEPDDLSRIALPAILHWDMCHFVVLTRVSRRPGGLRFHVHDPAQGSRILREEEVSRHFTGVLLELTPSASFTRHSERSELRISQLWSGLHGFWPALLQLLALSAILQLVALATPFFLQVSIDTVLPASDRDLLWILALGFGGLVLVSSVTGWLRSTILIRLGSTLSYQIVVNLFRHLLRLPLAWFEKRHVGDVISRFGAAQPIVQLLSSGLIAALLDGVMALLTLVMLLVFAPKLAALAFGAVVLTSALRFAMVRSLMQRNTDAILAAAVENSGLIETVRGIATIKAFGEEANRQRLWQQRKAESVNAQIRLGRSSLGLDTGQQLVLGLDRVIFVVLAVSDVMAGAMSVGMIFALQSYRQQFLDAASRLVEQGIALRMLDVQLARLADIALATPEETGADSGPLPDAVPGIELRNVHFRYGDQEPDILAGINLSIAPGEMIALVGPSGGGKTTLMKIMMGLLQPTAGEVLINGRPLARTGLASWRARIASIAQDDCLFAGSLADNITLFDPVPDMARIEKAARMAAILDDIDAMPLRFETQVGDMGSALSGGQKQRILLARAIYRQPLVLFLDEATAHLDQITEARILASMADWPITRIAIAHRSQSIRMASRIIVVSNGQISPSPSSSEDVAVSRRSRSQHRV